MNSKKFKQLDEGFMCLHCKSEVMPLGYTSRDHCPKCLYSIHVDINPGDRLNKCHGNLVPIGVEKFKKTYKIIYKCDKCGMIHKNIMASDDNYDEIVRLSVNNSALK